MTDWDDPTFVPPEDDSDRELERSLAAAEYRRRIASLPWPFAFTRGAELTTSVESDWFRFQVAEGELRVHVSFPWHVGRPVVEASDKRFAVASLENAAPPPPKNSDIFVTYGELGREPLYVRVFEGISPRLFRLDVFANPRGDFKRGLSIVLPEMLFERLIRDLSVFLTSPPHIWRRSGGGMLL
jgi:hypothetical protein